MKPVVEQIFELRQAEIRDVDLPNLRNHHEPFAAHLECVRQFHVAGEDQDQHVARTQPIVGVHGPALGRLELGADSTKDIQPEERQPRLDNCRRVAQGVRGDQRRIRRRLAQLGRSGDS